jgi:hypothetical protein
MVLCKKSAFTEFLLGFKWASEFSSGLKGKKDRLFFSLGGLERVLKSAMRLFLSSSHTQGRGMAGDWQLQRAQQYDPARRDIWLRVDLHKISH